MSLLASINFGIYLVLSPSHTYNTFRLASIYFGEIISCTKFTKIDGKPIFQALQYFATIEASYNIINFSKVQYYKACDIFILYSEMYCTAFRYCVMFLTAF